MSEENAAPAAEVTAPAQVEIVTPEKPTIEQTMGDVYDKMVQPRDEATQRFAAKDKPAETAAAVEPGAPAETTEGQPQSAASEPAAPAIAHPNSLPAELREKWGTVPPELAKWIGDRETESHKRISELGQTAKTSEQFQQVIDRYRATFKGLEPAAAFERLAQASAALDHDPYGAIKWLADSYRIDLSRFAGDPQQGTDEVAHLRATIGQLQQQIAETSNRVATREQSELQAQNKSIEKLISDFSTDKPYWAELEKDILAQIHAIRATEDLPAEKILERAYDRASKLNEGVQAKIAADKKAEEEKKAKAEAAKRAEAAKKAASINVKSGQGASPSAKKTMEETMREVADRLMG